MKRDYMLFVEDISDAIESIEEFIAGMSFDDFVHDKKSRSAVNYQLEIIGEAAKHIPVDIQKRYMQIPWNDMARTRDRIIHAYFGLNHEIIWRVVKERLPELKPIIRQILEELKA